MLVTRIFGALGALANRLWRWARRSPVPARPTRSSGRCKPPQAAPGDSSTDQYQPAEGNLCRNPDDDDGTVQEQRKPGHINDEDRSTVAGTAPNCRREPLRETQSAEISSGAVDQTPFNSTQVDADERVANPPEADDDQEHRLPETGPDPICSDPEVGGASPEKPRAPKRQPRNIGGRRQRTGHTTPGRQSRSPPSRPELICRRVAGTATWEVILTAGEDCGIAGVQLAGKPLEHTARECRLPSLTGRATVSCQDGQSHEVSLFEADPLIFKMRNDWSGEARKIARMTSGHFIVIAPATWERKGRVPVEPDRCADGAFRVHYFHRAATTTDMSLDGFREWSDSQFAAGIELRGRRVFDDSDEGDLFVGEAPSLECSSDIVWVRVGDETEQGWAENFLQDDQSLSEILGNREGRFFLRVYDSEARLLDSAAFRYWRDLRRISVDGSDYTEETVLAPNSIGHRPAEVRFVDADGSTIAPVQAAEGLLVTAPSGAIVIPPRPDPDPIECTLKSDTSAVNIVLDVPRIWWRLDGGRPDAGEWRDTPLVMTRQCFRELGRSNASMSLWSKRHTAVRAGFDDELAQPYRRNIDDDRIAVPLADFGDHAQIDRRLNDDAHFNVEWAGETISLIVISADPKPEILLFTAEPTTIDVGQEAILKWATKDADDARAAIDPDVGVMGSDGTFTVRPTETTKYTLTLTAPGMDGTSRTVTVALEQLSRADKRPVARVMSAASGWRSGKGFSLDELHEAGFTVKEAVERCIPIDRRRRTSHRANVNRVRSLLDG